jgi:adenylate kinase family enzyme
MINKKFLKIHSKKLKNLNIPNKKLLICFVGIPGSGKTYLAKIIEKKFKGIRINSDNLRKVINKNITKNNEEKEVFLKKYLLDLLNQFPFSNHLIILDSGIERKYKDIFKIAKSKKYKMFIIKMSVQKDLILKRIKVKDKKRFEEHPEDIKRWFKEYKLFNKKVKPDFIFKNNSDLGDLFSNLSRIIK